MSGRKDHRRRGKSRDWIHPSKVFENGGGACYMSTVSLSNLVNVHSSNVLQEIMLQLFNCVSKF